MEITKQDNIFLDQFKGKLKTSQDDIARAMKYSKYYKEASDDDIQTDAERVYKKLQTVNSEYMKWFEVLLAIVFALIGYMSPVWLLMFQKKMRLMEMEDEVMQFHTIILMLMKIERVNVEMILEWLERYSNIFKAPLSKCINNYEAGAWEALEAMKDEISYQEMTRIIESMQAAVEKIPIRDAFDELDSERDYYQEKRKEGKLLIWLKERFYSLINKISDVEFYKNASDFRLFNRKVLNSILDMEEYYRFSKGLFSYIGYNTYYMPYEVNERKYGKSSWSLFGLFKYALNGIIGFSVAPLKLATILGLITMILSLIYIIVIIIKKIFIGIAVSGYPTIICLILIFGGLQMFLLGVIGEYLGRTYVELKKRPIYIIKEEVIKDNK